MSSEYKLSLPAAILININIMMGSGLFINLIPVSKAAGLLSAFVYAIIGILMFPIVLAIAKLLQKHPGGSFYTFGLREINSFFGFLATWIYFIGKLASATLLIHFFTLIIQSLIPSFASVNSLLIDAIIISFFSYLNLQNLKVGSIVQYAFIVFKAIPILFIILSGIFLLNPGNLSPEFILWKGALPIVPLIIFAFAGFEAAASLSRHIKNPDKNAPLAVLISFAIVVFICVISNFFFYMVLGQDLANASYFQAFPLLLQKVFPLNELLRLKITSLLQLAIACSALGGAYGILFSNSWNLYSLAEANHIFLARQFTRLNKFNIPVFCILSETFICFFYLLITQGNNIPLQQIAAFGNLSAFMISALSLFYASINKRSNYFWLGLIATINCCGLLLICIRQTYISGGIHFLIFLSVLLLGVLMFFHTKKNN